MGLWGTQRNDLLMNEWKIRPKDRRLDRQTIRQMDKLEEKNYTKRTLTQPLLPSPPIKDRNKDEKFKKKRLFLC